MHFWPLQCCMEPWITAENRSQSSAKAVTAEVKSYVADANLPIPSSSWTVSQLRGYYDKNPDAANGKRWAKGDRTADVVS